MFPAMISKAMQKPRRLQPDCPARLYSYMCSVEQRSGLHSVQLRFVNCSEQKVDSLFLRICGIGEDGNPLYTMESVPLAGCAAEPRSVFGETRRLVLPSVAVAELEITVEWVLFSDGMLWKRLPTHRFDTPEALEMVRCACGMWNSAEAECCDFCAEAVGRPAEPEPMVEEPEEEAEPPVAVIPVPELSMEELERIMPETAALLRSMQEEAASDHSFDLH